MKFAMIFWRVVWVIAIASSQELQKPHFQVDHEAGKLDITASKDSADITFENDNLDLLLKPGDTKNPLVLVHHEHKAKTKDDIPDKAMAKHNITDIKDSATKNEEKTVVAENESVGNKFDDIDSLNEGNKFLNKLQNNKFKRKNENNSIVLENDFILDKQNSSGQISNITWKGRLNHTTDDHATNSHVLKKLDELKNLMAENFQKTDNVKSGSSIDGADKLSRRFGNSDKSQLTHDKYLDAANAIIEKVEKQQGETVTKYSKNNIEDTDYVAKAQDILNKYKKIENPKNSNGVIEEELGEANSMDKYDITALSSTNSSTADASSNTKAPANTTQLSKKNIKPVKTQNLSRQVDDERKENVKLIKTERNKPKPLHENSTQSDNVIQGTENMDSNLQTKEVESKTSLPASENMSNTTSLTNLLPAVTNITDVSQDNKTSTDVVVKAYNADAAVVKNTTTTDKSETNSTVQQNKENEEKVYASIDNNLTRNITEIELENKTSTFSNQSNDDESKEWQKYVYHENAKKKDRHLKKLVAWAPAKSEENRPFTNKIGSEKNKARNLKLKALRRKLHHSDKKKNNKIRNQSKQRDSLETNEKLKHVEKKLKCNEDACQKKSGKEETNAQNITDTNQTNIMDETDVKNEAKIENQEVIADAKETLAALEHAKILANDVARELNQTDLKTTIGHQESVQNDSLLPDKNQGKQNTSKDYKEKEEELKWDDDERKLKNRNSYSNTKNSTELTKEERNNLYKKLSLTNPDDISQNTSHISKELSNSPNEQQDRNNENNQTFLFNGKSDLPASIRTKDISLNKTSVHLSNNNTNMKSDSSSDQSKLSAIDEEEGVSFLSESNSSKIANNATENQEPADKNPKELVKGVHKFLGGNEIVEEQYGSDRKLNEGEYHEEFKNFAGKQSEDEYRTTASYSGDDKSNTEKAEEKNYKAKDLEGMVTIERQEEGNTPEKKKVENKKKQNVKTKHKSVQKKLNSKKIKKALKKKHGKDKTAEKKHTAGIADQEKPQSDLFSLTTKEKADAAEMLKTLDEQSARLENISNVASLAIKPLEKQLNTEDNLGKTQQEQQQQQPQQMKPLTESASQVNETSEDVFPQVLKAKNENITFSEAVSATKNQEFSFQKIDPPSVTSNHLDLSKPETEISAFPSDVRKELKEKNIEGPNVATAMEVDQTKLTSGLKQTDGNDEMQSNANKTKSFAINEKLKQQEEREEKITNKTKSKNEERSKSVSETKTSKESGKNIEGHTIEKEVQSHAKKKPTNKKLKNGKSGFIKSENKKEANENKVEFVNTNKSNNINGKPDNPDKEKPPTPEKEKPKKENDNAEEERKNTPDPQETTKEKSKEESQSSHSNKKEVTSPEVNSGRSIDTKNQTVTDNNSSNNQTEDSTNALTNDVSKAMEELEALMKEKTAEVNQNAKENDGEAEATDSQNAVQKELETSTVEHQTAESVLKELNKESKQSSVNFIDPKHLKPLEEDPIKALALFKRNITESMDDEEGVDVTAENRGIIVPRIGKMNRKHKTLVPSKKNIETILTEGNSFKRAEELKLNSAKDSDNRKREHDVEKILKKYMKASSFLKKKLDQLKGKHLDETGAVRQQEDQLQSNGTAADFYSNENKNNETIISTDEVKKEDSNEKKEEEKMKETSAASYNKNTSNDTKEDNNSNADIKTSTGNNQNLNNEKASTDNEVNEVNKEIDKMSDELSAIEKERKQQEEKEKSEEGSLSWKEDGVKGEKTNDITSSSSHQTGSETQNITDADSKDSNGESVKEDAKVANNRLNLNTLENTQDTVENEKQESGHTDQQTAEANEKENRTLVSSNEQQYKDGATTENFLQNNEQKENTDGQTSNSNVENREQKEDSAIKEEQKGQKDMNATTEDHFAEQKQMSDQKESKNDTTGNEKNSEQTEATQDKKISEISQNDEKSPVNDKKITDAPSTPESQRESQSEDKGKQNMEEKSYQGDVHLSDEKKENKAKENSNENEGESKQTKEGKMPISEFKEKDEEEKSTQGEGSMAVGEFKGKDEKEKSTQAESNMAVSEFEDKGEKEKSTQGEEHENSKEKQDQNLKNEEKTLDQEKQSYREKMKEAKEKEKEELQKSIEETQKLMLKEEQNEHIGEGKSLNKSEIGVAYEDENKGDLKEANTLEEIVNKQGRGDQIEQKLISQMMGGKGENPDKPNAIMNEIKQDFEKQNAANNEMKEYSQKEREEAEKALQDMDKLAQGGDFVGNKPTSKVSNAEPIKGTSENDEKQDESSKNESAKEISTEEAKAKLEAYEKQAGKEKETLQTNNNSEFGLTKEANQPTENIVPFSSNSNENVKNEEATKQGEGSTENTTFESKAVASEKASSTLKSPNEESVAKESDANDKTTKNEETETKTDENLHQISTENSKTTEDSKKVSEMESSSKQAESDSFTDDKSAKESYFTNPSERKEETGEHTKQQSADSYPEMGKFETLLSNKTDNETIIEAQKTLEEATSSLLNNSVIHTVNSVAHMQQEFLSKQVTTVDPYSTFKRFNVLKPRRRKRKSNTPG
ncbi:putative uncharacterized protein DDB_G0282133 [Hydractinia symbiolongicarpus]|uniref:putative uncharacterized protein DDB_G0282133 n=1 Tax=Hydractinia symbiolongicarpus TaxID=13093 RepID=UPI002550A1E8|nr:putative uncharacterized protein DDB_G0282133 [Hydractinia symbiolongicarpus]